jgi:hypothetical protein
LPPKVSKTQEIKIPCNQLNDYLHCEAVDIRGFDGWNGQTRHITISVKVNTSITLTVVVDHSQFLGFATQKSEIEGRHTKPEWKRGVLSALI